MPNYTATNLLKAIAKAEASFGAAETRQGSNAALALLLRNEPQVFRNANALKQSLSQPNTAIIQTRKNIVSGTAKEHDHSGAIGDSIESPITYVLRQQKFSVSYKLAENNQFRYQEQLNHGLSEAMRMIRKDLNAYGLAQLAANKSQVATANGITAFDGTEFAFENTAAESDFLAYNIKAALMKNDYSAPVDIIADQKAFKSLSASAAQGSGNDENLIWQFNGLSMAEDETLAVPAKYAAGGYLYAFGQGMAGMTSWNEPINRTSQYREVGSNTGLFTTASDPFISGLSYDVHVVNKLADTSGSNGNSQDVVDEYEVTAIVAYGNAYLSVANASPVFAVGQL
ncbi:MAG: hypothetical protein AAF039_12835 [Bacteroidota bacterium]